MDSLETPYEVEVPIDFIDCTVCHKSIRSETLYKIHLTTIGHIKKEDALVSSGLASRTRDIPLFEDIVQYLQYLNLDEPIIGLSYLQLVRSLDPDDQDPSPRYFCRLCVQEANLPNMINHVIGRKHRQKYLMADRKDLVTWDSLTVFNEAAKIIRAKAEIVERQDGCGIPKPMKQNKGKPNIRVTPKQRHMQYNDGPQEGHSGPEHHPGHYSHHEGNPPPFHPDDNYLGPEEEEREHYQRHRPLHSPQQDSYMENDYGRQNVMEPHYDRGYPEDPMGGGCSDRPFPQAELSPMRDFGEQMPRREAYEQEASPYRRPHPENDPLKQFYSEELRRDRARANEAAAAATDRMNYPPRDAVAYPPEGPDRPYPGRQPRESRYPAEAPDEGPIDYPYENDRFDRDIRQRSPPPEESYPVEDGHRAGYPEAQRRAYPDGRAPHSGYPDQDLREALDPRRNTRQPLDRGYVSEMAGASHHKMAGPRNAEDSSSYQMMPAGGRGMSGIPEPFRRFLQGDTSSQEVRKRKSRFSDATQEEMEGSKRMLMGLDGRSMYDESGPLRFGAQRHDPFSKQQSQYQRENVDNAGGGEKVFDILKNIEMDNGEEAVFLKSQLCNLLKDFQAKKLGNALQSRGDSVPISRDYHHGSAPLRASPPPRRAEPRGEAFREAMQWRTTEGHSRPTESHPWPSQDPRGWEEEEEERGGPPAERFQEHRRPVRQESNVSSRQRYEEVFGVVAQHRASQTPPTEDRYQDPGGPYDYTPAPPEFFDRRSVSPPHRRDHGYRRHGGLPHSSNLDKITSTLLELVARK